LSRSTAYRYKSAPATPRSGSCTAPETCQHIKKYLIQPAEQIGLDLIIQEKSNFDRIVATLGLKAMTQGTSIRKLCMYTTTNSTRQAVFKYNRLIRSICTPQYLRDRQLEPNICHSRNRIESYHQLRAAVANVGEKVATGALRL